MAIRQSEFRPAAGIGNAHLQTLLASTPLRARPEVPLQREALELPDGDFVHVDWAAPHREDSQRPVLLVLHGLEGSVRSRYAAAIMHSAGQAGWGAALLNARGCSGVPNRKAASYHAGYTADLHYFLQQFHALWPGRPLVAVGYSLGGNALLKYLGERGADTLLQAAVAVSVPFDLTDSAAAISSGFARLYQWVLMRRMRASVHRKLATHDMPVSAAELAKLRSFRQFDEQVTAPLHGFRGAQEYYEHASCRQYLHGIRVPTLILHAKDDPFMTPACIPAADQLSEQVTLELSSSGGHVGFLAGSFPWRLHSWLEPRIISHCQNFLPSRDELSTRQNSRNGEPLTAVG